ncbi:MAG: TetR/AcrR family transcriptional regulator [Proteobacteria bacterium]|nr:TetR/AcrR family transcriptional regulator [Pseudomonadota bacterium]
MTVGDTSDRAGGKGGRAKAVSGRRRLPPDERERLIVAEAVKFFAEVGFEGHTRDLARRLNITQPLLYRYFPSKEALIDRVYQEVYVNRWNPAWEALIEDRTQPLAQRLIAYYRDYARTILDPAWIRIFLFAGLKGGRLNARFLDMVRERIFTRVIREIRVDRGLPLPPELPFTEIEYELVWGLHASIFYIGIRKWIYGLPIPDDVNPIVDAKVTAFLEGVPAVMRQLAAAKP